MILSKAGGRLGQNGHKLATVCESKKKRKIKYKVKVKLKVKFKL